MENKKPEWLQDLLELPRAIELQIRIMQATRAGMIKCSEEITDILDSLIDTLENIREDAELFSYDVTNAIHENDLSQASSLFFNTNRIIEAIQYASIFKIYFTTESGELFSDQINTVSNNIEDLKSVLRGAQATIKEASDYFNVKPYKDEDKIIEVLDRVKKEIDELELDDESLKYPVNVTLECLIRMYHMDFSEDS